MPLTSLDSKLVSVIVPAYNAEKCLERCVESVLAQTYQHIEIVIIDDGSVDATPQIADVLAVRESCVKVFHQENAGLSGARNAGIDRSSGEFIFFLDADDYIDSEEISALFKVMTETNACMVVGGVTNITTSGDTLSIVKITPCVVDEFGFWKGYDNNTKTEQHSEYVVSCGKLFHRSLFENERFDIAKIHEDEFIIHRLVARAKSVTFADIAGYYYIQTEGSIMRTPSPDSLMDKAEGLIERSRYFVHRGWWKFALTAASEARGALSNSLETSSATALDERFIGIRRQWRRIILPILCKSPDGIGQKALCLLFALAPRAYIFIKRSR